jgi:glycosyltransferase involved in cell wall biosynthesis
LLSWNAGNIGPLRIAVTTYTLSTGGVSRFIFELAKYFRNSGHRITVICTDRKGSWFHRIGEEGLQGRSFNAVFYEWIPFGRILHSARIGRYMRKEAYDVVINNGSFYIHASAGYFLSRTRIIHVVHNQREQMVELESDPMSDKVVGVSPGIELKARNYLPADRITTIPNGVRIPDITDEGPGTCSRRPSDLLYVGRIDQWQKGILILPRIIKYILDRGIEIKITIVGDGPDMQRLVHSAEEMGVAGHMEFTGNVAPGMVNSFYRGHKIFLLPSRFEGHPLTLMEAMAHGCVPVVSLLPFSTDICIDGGVSGFLVRPDDLPGFGERIIQLLEEPDLLNTMSRRAAEKVREQFSIDTTHEKYFELIKDLGTRNISDRPARRINRKYLTWKEIVPFRLIMAWKINITRKKQDGISH